MEQTRRSFLGQSLGTAMSAALCGSAALSATVGLVGSGGALANTVEPVTSELTVGSSAQSPANGQWNAIVKSNVSRRLRLVNVHTHEKISVVYRKGDDYIGQALKQINFLLRDYRADEVLQIDPATIDYLYNIYTTMESDQYIQILSGYRSPATNEMLRQRSIRKHTIKVAKKSLHIVGKAIDFRIPGKPTKDLQLAALDLKLGGIGYYQKSDFVHIDSGHFRRW